MFLKAGDIDAALFQHITVRQVDHMHGHILDAVLDTAFAGQERGPHTPCDVRQAQVEAGRLHLIGIKSGLAGDGTCCDQGLDTLKRDDAGLGGNLETGHAVLFSHGNLSLSCLCWLE